MPKPIPNITAMLTDFHTLARCDDASIFARFQFYSANSRKRVFPKSTKYNAYRVERAPNRLAIHFLDTSKDEQSATQAIYSFIPAPDFSQQRFGS